MIIGTIRNGAVTVRSRGVIETRTSPNAPGRTGSRNDAPVSRATPARRQMRNEE